MRSGEGGPRRNRCHGRAEIKNSHLFGTFLQATAERIADVLPFPDLSFCLHDDSLRRSKKNMRIHATFSCPFALFPLSYLFTFPPPLPPLSVIQGNSRERFSRHTSRKSSNPLLEWQVRLSAGERAGRESVH